MIPVKRFLVKTLGCKANFSDGQAIEAGLIRHGFAPASSEHEADVIIVNSCTVTDEADRQSRKMIRDFAAKNPQAQVVYTGCGAEVNPGQALQIQGLSAVIGNQDKSRAADLIAGHLEGERPVSPVILGSVADYGELVSRHPMDREWPLAEEGAIEAPELPRDSSSYRTRAFLKIQEGCDSFCTYCIIPYGRGPARSLGVESVLARILKLVESGIKEVVLTGTNIGDYGSS
ncbi:MAG: radical SAM protein [Proteobacteria bacterium]|nr:radical SAM protein [Pseudomonadota bacterium]